MSNLDFDKLDLIDKEVKISDVEKTTPKRRSVTDKFKEETKEEIKEEKKKTGPKKVFPMQTVSFNFEKSVSEALDHYCTTNMFKKSELVRVLLKDHMESLGYEFSLEDLKEGTYKK